MHRECASYRAVPGLSLLAVRHESRPVAPDEPTDVLIPAIEATPSTTTIYYQVVQSQVGHMHPVTMTTILIINTHTTQAVKRNYSLPMKFYLITLCLFEVHIR